MRKRFTAGNKLLTIINAKGPVSSLECGIWFADECILYPYERNACANVKGDVEWFKSRLMIRDDMRHSSLSDVWVDCCYCSLSFIVAVLLPVGPLIHTLTLHMYKCVHH